MRCHGGHPGEHFIGIILLPIVGNACEHAAAVRFAMQETGGGALTEGLECELKTTGWARTGPDRTRGAVLTGQAWSIDRDRSWLFHAGVSARASAALHWMQLCAASRIGESDARRRGRSRSSSSLSPFSWAGPSTSRQQPRAERRSHERSGASPVGGAPQRSPWLSRSHISLRHFRRLLPPFRGWT